LQQINFGQLFFSIEKKCSNFKINFGFATTYVAILKTIFILLHFLWQNRKILQIATKSVAFYKKNLFCHRLNSDFFLTHHFFATAHKKTNLLQLVFIFYWLFLLFTAKWGHFAEQIFWFY
jgi:hypothetical protein